MRSFLSRFASPAILVAAMVVAGCDNSESKPATSGTTATEAPKPAVAAEPAKPAAGPIIPVAQAIDWCREHSMPESVCVQCHPEMAAGFKAKGDWDEQHALPKSQCFKCDPTLKEKFAVAFKEKTGKEPPAAE
jgi:hypothetical protein